ncbi:hypothetical protein H9I32_13225 [Bacillus sp. Xin]|nr:hypothetical protein [Bacillus sp. TL12]MBC6973301.1 hypothetical protein [Bacillus sp. Xin]MCI0764939.1 hypothetical protein [Bacillus sp. TL12]NSW35696.1 hypothetical protein [Bacillus sp. Xin1]
MKKTPLIKVSLYAIGQMVGPGIAGWIIEKVSFAAAYGLGALGFLISLCIIGLRLKIEGRIDSVSVK